MYGFKLLILFTCLSWSYCKLYKYCSLCADHTMCKYHGIGENCKGGGESGISEEDKKQILGMHNWLRRLVASGSEKKGVGGKPQPKAANLMKFEWDEELAKVAQRWADQCQIQHDSCRDDPRWKVGQNIYWSWKNRNHVTNWTEAILSWYNEVSLYDPNEVNSYRFESATGHYTQMLWHDTHAIGCGRKDYGANKLYVCNYGPAGNWINDPMYEIGEPCSKCPHNTVCDSYLCVKPKPAEEVKPQTNFDSNFLRILTEKKTSNSGNVNEAKNLEVLVPPFENAEDFYAAEFEKTNRCKILNQTPQNQSQDSSVLRALNDDFLTVEENQKSAINSIDENGIELDIETIQGIEEIKIRIENLVKNAVKKSKAKH